MNTHHTQTLNGRGSASILGKWAIVLAALLPAASIHAAEDFSGWSVNFTPVLVMQDGYRLGGGVDPEVKYTLDQGGARLAAGLRLGGYYVKEAVGVTVMPTLRLTVPVGKAEPYASFGMGYGWIPDAGDEGIATLSRLGVVFRVRRNIAIGAEGAIQKLEGTNLRFPSLGSMMTFNL